MIRLCQVYNHLKQKTALVFRQFFVSFVSVKDGQGQGEMPLLKVCGAPPLTR